ncbi:PsaB, chloroplast [Artemisia annua]|uniref:PsaB, chloroplast n=1 Tax=Artemisia annua TaxID=35608 RepID=A0A2U1LLZ8_ARTAN|nr:PsaB, chloroplast [Artemisia annua]
MALGGPGQRPRRRGDRSNSKLQNTSRLNHHLSGLFGVSSLAWTGHLVHVAIPASRGEYVRWNNFLDVLPHPQGLGPLFTGQWNLYAQNPDSSSHLFGTSQGAGTAILTLLGGFHPQTQS